MSDEIGHELALRIPTRSNCKTCQLGYNVMGMIHRQAINGAPVMDIWRTLVELEHDNLIRKAPSRASIAGHLKNHLGVKDQAIRKHIERRAQERNKDIENGVENLLTDIAVAENIVALGHQMIVEGKIKLEARDVLAANKQVHDFTKDESGSLDAATAYVQLGIVMQAIRDTVPEDMWARITARVQQLSSDEEVIETAELVEDEIPFYD